MPRYFFHMAQIGRQLSDEKGRETSSLSAAYEHALHMIHKTMSYLVAEETDGWMVNIANASGRVELTVLFPKRCVGYRNPAELKRSLGPMSAP